MIPEVFPNWPWAEPRPGPIPDPVRVAVANLFA